jgi:hypothetical protein
MSKDPVEYLRHILAECQYIQSVITPELSQDTFLADETPAICSVPKAHCKS